MPVTLKFEMHCWTNFTLHLFLQFFIKYLQTLNIACINNLYKPLELVCCETLQMFVYFTIAAFNIFVTDRSTALHLGVGSDLVGWERNSWAKFIRINTWFLLSNWTLPQTVVAFRISLSEPDYFYWFFDRPLHKVHNFWRTFILLVTNNDLTWLFSIFCRNWNNFCEVFY